MKDCPTLTLAVSTMGNRLSYALDMVEELTLDDCEVVIVIQKPPNSIHELINQHPSINFVVSHETGLSKSRNLALLNATGLFVWLLDDDVMISQACLTRAIALVKENQHSQFIRVRVGCSERKNELYKTYKSEQTFFKLLALQFNSIELLLNRQWLCDRDLSFNPKIGLGSKFPGAEEIHFVLDAVEKGASVVLVDEVLVFHPCDAGGRRKTQNANMMEIRGATASRFGFLGMLLLLRWCFRYWMEYKQLNMLTSMCRGFINGYASYK